MELIMFGGYTGQPPGVDVPGGTNVEHNRAEKGHVYTASLPWINIKYKMKMSVF